MNSINISYDMTANDIYLDCKLLVTEYQHKTLHN